MKTCTHSGCSRPQAHKALCHTHYRRLRLYGSATGGGPFRARPGEPLAFLKFAETFEGDECLIWPYARNSAGYGHMVICGKNHLVTRMVCEKFNGPPPTEKHEAAHSCGNGHAGCVNGSHLAWKTSVENKADMVSHGTSQRGERQWMAVLTQEKVIEIRKMAGNCSTREIADRFGVSIGVITHVIKRHSWNWVQ
jgi:DNA-binding CsgD family transcriptional regulator